jgi:tetratricopeptide (TPR) repeat protein
MNAADRLFTRWWINQRANVAMLLKRSEAAIACYRELLALDPSDEVARSTLGNLLMEKGDAAGASDEFERLVEIDPANAEAWFNLGFVYEQRDRLADAERCFRRAVELKPSIDRAWYGLGLALIRCGRLREAVDVLRKNIELQPFSPYGYYQLGMTYHHLGESAEALRIHDKLKGFEPRYAATLKRDMENNTPKQKAGDEHSSTRLADRSREEVDATQ